MTTSTTRTAAELRAAIKQKTERRDEIAAQLEEQRRRAEAIRTEIGRAVAKGTPSDTLRREVRDREDTADGLARALPILEEEMESLRSELAAAERSEAAAGYRAAEAAAVAALEAVDTALRQFEGETLAPLVETLREALDAADRAERVDNHLSGAREVRGYRLGRATWEQHPGLLGLLQALRGHADGDLRSVSATNSYSQAIRDF